MKSLRPGPSGYPVGVVCLLSALYLVPYLAAYHSFACGPLLLIALAPFALAVCGARNGSAAIAIITGTSLLLWFFGNLFFATYNWAALLGLSLLHAAIIGLSAIALRWWYRKTGWPLVFLVPVTFVAGEFVRLSGPFGIPTGILALGFYQDLWIIQIADLGGMYLVSFAVAAVGGAIADVIMGRWRRTALITAITGWLAIAGYGFYRLRESRQTMRPGPVIGVVQSDIPMSHGVALGFDRQRFLDEMLAFNDQSAATVPKPSLIVWPEGMDVVPPLNSEWLTMSRPDDLPAVSRHFERTLRAWTERNGVPLLVGSVAVLPGKERSSPLTIHTAALLLGASAGDQPLRQYKQRLFPIGETIPGRGTFIGRWLERFVVAHSSVPTYGWLTPGTEQVIFPLKTPRGETLRYAICMCIELCYAKPSGVFLRDAKGGKGIDFLVNMSNEAVFQRNRAQIFEASTSAFRAVEARIGVARSSNTGISGFVKPTGEMYGEVRNARGQIWTGLGAPELPRIAALVKFRQEHAAEIASDPVIAQKVRDEIAAIEELRREAGVSGQSTETVYIDSRQTLYSRTGDVLPWSLLIFAGSGLAASIAQRTWRALGPRTSS